MATLINRQQPQLPSDREIIDACDRNPPCDENEESIKGLMYPPQAPIFWIKYGLRSEGREAEARTQDFAFKALERMPQSERDGIRVPEVYRIFTDDYHPSEHAMVYIVMEYVPGKTLLQILDETPFETQSQRLEHLYDQIAKAIRLLLSIEVPYDATPGPYGGGIIRHPLFKDYKASIEYSSVAQLQHHINKINTHLNSVGHTVDFSNEKLYFCFCDFYEGNFIFSDDGSLCIIDFEHAGFLPISLLTFALIQRRPVCNAIRDKLSLPQENIPGMRLACSYFGFSARRIGLPL